MPPLPHPSGDQGHHHPSEAKATFAATAHHHYSDPEDHMITRGGRRADLEVPELGQSRYGIGATAIANDDESVCGN
uniref:Uncharacterized protein n=1 Tax=Oryza sativa subsp. japonica TaxID=39947 RepID=Q6ZJP4_ORYSJ|nr:hypothetical protein [Oryza sativa Japonica Group]